MLKTLTDTYYLTIIFFTASHASLRSSYVPFSSSSLTLADLRRNRSRACNSFSDGALFRS